MRSIVAEIMLMLNMPTNEARRTAAGVLLQAYSVEQIGRTMVNIYNKGWITYPNISGLLTNSGRQALRNYLKKRIDKGK